MLRAAATTGAARGFTQANSRLFDGSRSVIPTITQCAAARPAASLVHCNVRRAKPIFGALGGGVAELAGVGDPAVADFGGREGHVGAVLPETLPER